MDRVWHWTTQEVVPNPPVCLVPWGSKKCCALPFWFAFTGCDTMLHFAGRGKKTAWNTWLNSRDASKYITHFVVFGRFLKTIENNDESNGNNRSIELRSVLRTEH